MKKQQQEPTNTLSADVQRGITACLPIARYRHTYGFRLRVSDVETPSGISMTVPGEGLSLKEMSERYRRTGMAPDPRGSFRPGFYGDGDLDDDDLQQVNQSDIVDQTAVYGNRKQLAVEEQERQKAEKSKASGKDTAKQTDDPEPGKLEAKKPAPAS